MFYALLWTTFCLAQDAALAERLKRDGWKAVEELAAKPAAKADLEKLATGDDEELKWWAGAALAEIDARERGGAAFLALRPVTLEAKERPAHEVLNALLAPDDLRLTGDLSPAATAVTVSFKATPFLQAVDEVCRQARCALRRKPNGDLEAKVDDEEEIGRPIAYPGAHAILLSGVTHRTVMDFSGGPNRTFHLNLTSRGDPRAWIRVEPSEWTIVSAVDDAGAPMKPGGGNGKGWSGNNQPPSVYWNESFPAPARTVKRIARLRGIATLTIARKPVEMVFTDVLKEVDQVREAGKIRVTLKPVGFIDRQYTVKLEISPKGALGRPTLDDLELEDSEGRGFSDGSGSEGEDGIFRFFSPFGKAQTPARVRVTVLPDCHVRKIYFELKDVPIR